jgi:hypothetical protein
MLTVEPAYAGRNSLSAQLRTAPVLPDRGLGSLGQSVSSG